MKINIFKIDSSSIDSLTEELEENGFECLYDEEPEGFYKALYLSKKSSNNQGWINYYKPLLENDEYDDLVAGIGSNSLSGVMLIQNNEADTTYAISHGQAHFLVRKHCNKDFGLDLAERIANVEGLKLKHSQTFSSLAKKDITSYNKNRKLDSSYEYAEAFNYVKCKTNEKSVWGDTVDFGESACFSFGKKVSYKPSELENLIIKIDEALQKDANIHLPRYHKVKDKELINALDKELDENFEKYLSDLITDDYWLTGVSFNFSSEFSYSVKYKRTELIPLSESLDIKTVKDALEANKELVNNDYSYVKVIFYDEEGKEVFHRPLRKMIQATVDFDNKYYVYAGGEWIEFSKSYVSYIEAEVDKIELIEKDDYGLNEDDLIPKMVSDFGYTQLHRSMVYFKGYSIEQADLINDDNIVMVKDQKSTADIVYLVKQATTALRTAYEQTEIPNNFDGHNVCLWILSSRTTMPASLSKLRSFHILDALNDFQIEARKKNLNPVVWFSTKSN